jgi:hypothetical protein
MLLLGSDEIKNIVFEKKWWILFVKRSAKVYYSPLDRCKCTGAVEAAGAICGTLRAHKELLFAEAIKARAQHHLCSALVSRSLCPAGALYTLGAAGWASRVN